MKKLMPFLSAIALALVIVPTLMYLGDAMDRPRLQTFMLVGTVLWFASAPFWMGKTDR